MSKKPDPVKLGWGDIMMAAFVGVLRTVNAKKDSRKLEKGRLDEGWENNINGAIGEFAVSKVFNIHWSPSTKFPDTHIGDVGKLQVKATTRGDGHLLIRKRDDEKFPFILVTLALPFATVVGWMEGVEAKQDKYWQNIDKERRIHQAAWFVPQKDLQPIEELKQRLTKP